MLGTSTNQPPLSKLTIAELLSRSAEYAAKARADGTDAYYRAAYHRLARRYAILAAERELAEESAVRHQVAGRFRHPAVTN